MLPSPVHRSAPLIPPGLHCVGVPSLSDHRQANFFERRRPGRASRTENPSLVLTLALAWGRRGAAAAAWDAHRTTPTDTVGHFYLQSAPGPGWLTLVVVLPCPRPHADSIDRQRGRVPSFPYVLARSKPSLHRSLEPWHGRSLPFPPWPLLRAGGKRVLAPCGNV